MCRRVTCSTCRKPTYAGCGMHIEQVLADVPPADRCACKSAPKDGGGGGGKGGSWWRRLLGL